MEQHRVPQNISTYQFRLVGDMTLKQFAELAAGALVAFLFYSSPLPFFLKFPAVISFAFLGAALAFLPVQERPLDRWIISFFKAIYSPTQYRWQKRPRAPDFLQPKAAFLFPQPKEEKVRPADKRRLKEYLATLPAEEKEPFEEQREGEIKKLTQLFQIKGATGPIMTASLTPSELPQMRVQPGVRIRKLGDSLEAPLKIKSLPRAKEKKAEEKGTGEPKVDFKPLISPEPINFEELLKTKKTVAKKATFVHKRPGLLKAEAPNILTGLVLTLEGRFIPGAIVSVVDENNLPVRALKSNALGQFFSATPLKNGRYQIEIEKEGYHFDIISLEVEGEIIPPVEIKAKKSKEPEEEGVRILEF